MKTLSSFDFRNKTVIIRIDLNSPYDSKKKKIVDNERIQSAVLSLRELIKKKAKIVVLAHQGRKGEDDFVSLDVHAKLLSKYLRKKVIFVKDVAGAKAKTAIKKLKPGDVLLIDNVRFLKDEGDEKKALVGKSTIVKALSPLADIFVNDAFSVSHRAQASVVGFAKRLPCCFGRLMQEELESTGRVMSAKSRNVYILGGAKAGDCVDILDHILKTDPREIEYALLCGVTANIFMKAGGMEIGKKSEDLLKKKGLWPLLKTARTLLKKYPNKLILPVDVVVMKGKKITSVDADKVLKDAQIYDVGKKTVNNYKKIIRHANTVIIKGPAGLYEDKRFSVGTKEIFKWVANSHAYTIVGGGDTTQAIDKLKINRKKFSHVSLGGGALITYLSGKPMPGVKAINEGRRQ